MNNLSDKQLIDLMIQLKSNSILLDEILDELTIRKHLTYLNESYIDEILDTFNENKRLFELTNDVKYEDKMFGYQAEFYKVTSGE
jgi:ribosomal protein S17E